MVEIKRDNNLISYEKASRTSDRLLRFLKEFNSLTPEELKAKKMSDTLVKSIKIYLKTKSLFEENFSGYEIIEGIYEIGIINDAEYKKEKQKFLERQFSGRGIGKVDEIAENI